MSIKIENLTYIYGENGPYEMVALDNVNAEIQNGEFIGLIGHTGSGKSTLIQHINGLLKPKSGTIYIDGVNVFDKNTDVRQIRKKVGIVFQYPEYQLFEETVYKDIAFGPLNYSKDKKMVDDVVRESAKLVGVSQEMLEKSPFELSGGEKRRVAIAGILAMEPNVLILDEPAAGLDPYGRKAILEEIKNIHKEKKITVILVSHSMDDIAVYADRIFVMHKGKLVMADTPSEIFKNEEEIEKMGLDIPQITKILNYVKKKGYEVSDGIFDVKSAADILEKILKGEKNA